MIAEPRAGGTAPALAWARSEIARRDSADDVMICVHADWAIGDDAEFRATLARAADARRAAPALVTVGIVPTRPDPGFGYIQPGDELDGARRVARFAEKPNRATRRAHGARWLSLEFRHLRVARGRFSRRRARAHTRNRACAVARAVGRHRIVLFGRDAGDGG